MKLRLLLRGPGRLLSAIPEKILESGHIVIGRSPEADWMIPDIDRVISKLHCRIDATVRGFLLTDTSTNGIRINDIPVGGGLPSPLSNGDVLMLGDAIISVEILAPPAAAPSPLADSPPDSRLPARYGKLHTLVLADGTPENLTIFRIIRRFVDEPFGIADTF
eukprot:gene5711-7740_t